MSLIKGFFSKLFVGKPQNTIVEKNDDSLLKEAARDAVVKAFQKNEKSPHLKDSEGNENIHPDVLKILEEYNDVFFSAFHIPKVNYKLKIDKKSVIVQVNDKDFEAMLSKSDKLSNSYEHIFLRIVQKEGKNFEQRLFLHAGSSAQRHHNYIMNMGKKMALRVKKTGHKITIPAKSNYERSLIHGVVEKIPGIASKSIGPYYQRRLVIYPIKTSSQTTPQTVPNE